MSDDPFDRLRFLDVTRTNLGDVRVLGHPAPAADVQASGVHNSIIVSFGDLCGDGVTLHLTFEQASSLIEQLKEVAREHAR